MATKISAFLLFGILLFQLTGCFKDEPKKVMTRAAGPWTISKVIQENYDTLGNVSGTGNWENLGTLFLYHDDNFMYVDVFHLQYSTALQNEVVSNFQYNLFNSNRWWMSVEAKQFGFGNYEGGTGYTSTAGLYTIEKLNNRKLEILNIELYSSTGQVKMIEHWYFERAK